MKSTQVNNKNVIIDGVNYAYSKLNRKGTKEFKAWFTYYFNMEYSMINLLTEDQVRHCYIVIRDIAAKKEFRKNE
jgi:hypothetical protein